MPVRAKMEDKELILPINDKFRLAANRFSWMIQQARKRKGQIVWVAINWFPSLEMAVNALGNLMVRTSDVKTVDEVLREAKKVTDTMVQALSPKFDLSVDDVRCQKHAAKKENPASGGNQGGQ